MLAVLVSACIRQRISTRVGQAEHVIQLAVSQQPGIGGDRGAAKLKDQPAVKIEPQGPAARFTHRVPPRRPNRSPASP
jgi:hypothetical protein